MSNTIFVELSVSCMERVQGFLFPDHEYAVHLDTLLRYQEAEFHLNNKSVGVESA